MARELCVSEIPISSFIVANDGMGVFIDKNRIYTANLLPWQNEPGKDTTAI